MDLPRILTVSEVAEHLRCHPSTVYRMIDAGELAAIHVGVGKTKNGVRVTETALARFLAGHTEAVA